MSSEKPAPAHANKTILYFYLGFHESSGLPRYNPFDYRFLDVLCKRYRVIVALFTRGGSMHLTERIAPANVEIVFIRDFPAPKRIPAVILWPLRTFTRVLCIAFLLRSIRPDLVNGNWITRSSGFYCALTDFHPFLATAWGSDVLIEARKSLILRAFGQFTLRLADAVIVDSEVQRRAVLDLGCNPSKIYCFPWGIDLKKFKPAKDITLRVQLGWSNERIIISTRMHFPHYGIEHLLKAIPLILAKAKDVRFLIIGDGPLLQHHKNLVNELGVGDKVKFLGLVPNDHMPTFLNCADIYVSTSYSDGTSASLLEAMACGLPIVATKIPANEEWIIAGENGFLVPAADSLKLAECIVAILQNDRMRLRMGRKNLRLASQRADWKKNSLVFEKCVSDLLSSARN